MTDQEFLRRRLRLRLMKQITEMRQEREAHEGKPAVDLQIRSPESDKSLKRLQELATKLDRLMAGAD